MHSAKIKNTSSCPAVADDEFATKNMRFGNVVWEVRRELPHGKIFEIMRNPEAFLQNRELFLKNTRVVTVARVPAGSDGEPALVLRRLNYGKAKHRLKDAFRTSRVRRALRRGLLLEERGIATPPAFAAADVSKLLWPHAAYLITKEIPGARTLIQFLAKNPRPARRVVTAMADLLARLHDSNFSHRDLKPTNILLDANLNPFLIDLDGLRVWKKLTTQRAVADLARLTTGIARHQKELRFASWRFLKRYCEQRETTFSVRALAAQIEKKLRV